MNSAGIQRSREHLLEYLEKRGRVGERLPSIKALAAQAHVGVAAMCAAVTDMAAKSKLTVIRRRGIFAGTVEHTEAPAPRRKWEAVAQLIKSDIFEGRFAGSRLLPSPRQLQVRYGVSYATLKKALTEISSERLIARDRWRFEIRRVARWTTGGSIVLICGGDFLDNFYISGRNEEFLRTLERETSERGLSLHILRHVRMENDWALYDWYRRKADFPRSAIGAIILAEIMSGTDGMIGALGKAKIPTAVLDEMGNVSPGTWKSVPRIAIFRVAYTPEAGYNAGNFLLRHGHRSVAYISPFHWQEWSRNRLTGMERSFANAGIRSLVHPCVNIEPFDPWNFSSTVQTHLAHLIPSNSRFTWLFRQLDKFRSSLDCSVRSEATQIHNQAAQVRRDAFYRSYCRPLFELALEKKDVTAWVFCSDEIARFGLEFLRERGIEVPGKVSAMGFDDLPVAFRINLTSMNFNLTAIAHRMLSFIINPEKAGIPLRNPLATIEPVIITRGSVRSI